MAGNQITITFAGDSKSLERTFDRVGDGAKDMAADMDKASSQVTSFGGKIDSMNDSVDGSESRLMGAADLLDGLGGAFGLPVDGAVNMARSFADMAGGITGFVVPAVQRILGMLGLQTAATGAQTAATGAATAAQGGLNAALAANPIGLVVLAIAGLVGAFVLAWQHSETFRDIVRAALDTVRDAAGKLWDFFRTLPDKLWGLTNTIKDAVLWPFKTAFNEVSKLWNNTVGRLSFEIPSWVPGMGGKGFSMPNLPTFHQGGTIPGNPGTAVPILAMAGEQIIPAGGGAGGTTIVINAGTIVSENQLADLVQKVLLRKQSRTGSLGLA